MHTTEQQHIANGPDGGALWQITTGGNVSYEVRYHDERTPIFSPPDELPPWAKAAISERTGREIGNAITEAVTNAANAVAALKTATAEKHSDEQHMYALFGGPPRNRAERRRWARIQKQEARRR